MRFKNRQDAGRQLALSLADDPIIQQADPGELLVLSIPRGGVILGDVIASQLKCAHDVVVVKKIGFPGFSELAIGAIAEDGTTLRNDEIIAAYHLTGGEVTAAIAKAQHKVEKYIRLFRQGQNLSVAGKTVIVVDDGIATGETLRTAIHWLKEEHRQADNIIVAIPVSPPDSLRKLRALADKVICLSAPWNFRAVSQYYVNFDQVDDEEVLNILEVRNHSDQTPVTDSI